MMMFSEIAFAIELLALSSGIGLLIWSMRNEGDGVKLGRFFGYLISTLALLLILFSIIAAIVRSVEMMNLEPE